MVMVTHQGRADGAAIFRDMLHQISLILDYEPPAALEPPSRETRLAFDAFNILGMEARAAGIDVLAMMHVAFIARASEKDAQRRLRWSQVTLALLRLAAAEFIDKERA